MSDTTYATKPTQIGASVWDCVKQQDEPDPSGAERLVMSCADTEAGGAPGPEPAAPVAEAEPDVDIPAPAVDRPTALLAAYEAALEADIDSDGPDSRLGPVSAGALLALARAVRADSEQRERRMASEMDDVRRQVAALASRSVNVTVAGVTLTNATIEASTVSVCDPLAAPQPAAEPDVEAPAAPVAGLGDTGKIELDEPAGGKRAKAASARRSRVATRALTVVLAAVIVCCLAFVAVQAAGILG